MIQETMIFFCEINLQFAHFFNEKLKKHILFILCYAYLIFFRQNMAIAVSIFFLNFFSKLFINNFEKRI